jgi:hypothetical protein
VITQEGSVEIYWTMVLEPSRRPTLAAVDPRNNRKLMKDLDKPAHRLERYRFVFFMALNNFRALLIRSAP